MLLLAAAIASLALLMLSTDGKSSSLLLSSYYVDEIFVIYCLFREYLTKIFSSFSTPSPIRFFSEGNIFCVSSMACRYFDQYANSLRVDWKDNDITELVLPLALFDNLNSHLQDLYQLRVS